jgi:hypothetical protein
MSNIILQNPQDPNENRTVDPSRFEDPMARQADWNPAKGGGVNYRTHNLTEVNSNRLEFRASLVTKLLCLLFILFGVGMLSILYFEFFSQRTNTQALGFVGLLLITIGVYMLYANTAPIVFDKQKGFFWKGRKAPDEMSNGETLKDAVRLGEIQALQLISEYCKGNKSSYFSYELNLVLKNGQRINVIDHGNRNKLRENAATLSAFLAIPVWDGIFDNIV